MGLAENSEIVVIISETEGKALAEGEDEKRRTVEKNKEENGPTVLEQRPADA